MQITDPAIKRETLSIVDDINNIRHNTFLDALKFTLLLIPILIILTFVAIFAYIFWLGIVIIVFAFVVFGIMMGHYGYH